MRPIYILISVFFLIANNSCSDQPMDSEQYKKEIYLIGAYDQVWPLDIMYSDEPAETYITVTSSGSLNLDKDVKVELEIDESLVDRYNELFLGILNLEKYYIPLDQNIYKIPSLENVVIEHKKSFSKNVPVFIETIDLDPDGIYAIPIRIKSTSEYSVNISGEKMLVRINLKNMFHDQYKMEGTITDSDGNSRIIQKTKNLKAIKKQAVRLFIAAENEVNENLATKSIVLTIDENSTGGDKILFPVMVTAWDAMALDVRNGTGVYNDEEKTFEITYSIIVNGKETIYNETLSNLLFSLQ